MSRGRRKQAESLDGRPLGGYGLMLENDRNVGYNYRIDTIFLSVLGGPILVLLGIGIATASDPEVHRIWYVGATITVVGAAFFVWGVYATIRGVVRWRRHRVANKALMAEYADKDVPHLKLDGR